MVLWYKSNNQFDYNFQIVSYSWLNRYPNPFATHVRSVDTISSEVDSMGNLRVTRLIKKSGNLPLWARPFLRNITDSWIIEQAIVDPKEQSMKTYTRNLDHTTVIRVEEFNDYKFDFGLGKTLVNSRVKFSSGFRKAYGVGIKDRIENWSHNKFAENIKKSRQGLLLVMKNFHLQRRLKSENQIEEL